MGDRKTFLINELIKFSHRLDSKGFTANHDGNLSVKMDDVILATPTAESKGLLTKEMIITLDQSGKKIEGIGNPFSEIDIHLACYKHRSDAVAVIHAHPPVITALGLTSKSLEIHLPEAIVSLGETVPCTEFLMPGCTQLNQVVSEILKINDTFIIPGNGIVSIGDTIEQAYLRIELAEHVAKINYFASQMGAIRKLSKQEKEILLAKRVKANLGPIARFGKPAKEIEKKQIENEHNPLRKIIEEELKKILRDE